MESIMNKELKVYGRRIGFILCINGEVFSLIAREARNGLTNIHVCHVNHGSFDEGDFNLGRKLRQRSMQEIKAELNKLEGRYANEGTMVNEEMLKYEFAKIINS